MEKALCFTGHRPNKLGGYGGSRAKATQDAIFGCLVKVVERAASSGFDTFITGGALGVDQIAAEAVIYRRKHSARQGIKLIVGKPFPSQGSAWPKHAQEHLEKICEQADQVVNVSPDPYTREKMQIRNEWMVDRSHACCAVWHRGVGGTANCVSYARKMWRPILIINPYTLGEEWELPNIARW